MRLPWHRQPRPEPRELAEARKKREEAEQKLDEARKHVIIPLRELRERNHVSEAITMLIQRRVQGRAL